MEAGTQIAVLHPTKISLPGSALPILESLEQDLQDGRWSIRAMPRVTEKLQDAARRTIALVETRMAPAAADWASGSIATLLGHYYTADMPREVYNAVARDWMACLGEFPAWAIDQARIAWLKTGKRKPIPSDIVALCQKAVGKDRATLFLCRRILDSPIESPQRVITVEERAANREAIADILRGIRGALTSPVPPRGDWELTDPSVIENTGCQILEAEKE